MPTVDQVRTKPIDGAEIDEAAGYGKRTASVMDAAPLFSKLQASLSGPEQFVIRFADAGKAFRVWLIAENL